MARFEEFIASSDLREIAHRHNYFMILVATAGKGKQLIDFESFDVFPGMVFLMYPGQIHAWESEEDLKGMLLFFTNEFFSLRYHNNILLDFPFFHSTAQQPFIQPEAKEFERLEWLSEAMLEEYANAKKDYLRVLRSYLNVFLLNCNRHYETNWNRLSGKDKNAALIVHNFEQLIDQYFQSKHKVSDYAEMLLITPNYLNAVCNKVTGRSAGELIRHRIMLEAKRMLLHESRTVAEIGHDLNFQDNSYFCRFFKKYEGCSPEKFRKVYRMKEHS